MKILIPTVDYPPIEGGIGTVALQLAREAAAMGHEVTVVAPRLGKNYSDGFDAAVFDASEPVRILRFGGYWLGWFRLFPLLLKTWPELRNTDLILGINVSYGGVLGYWAKQRHGTPYLTFAYAYEFMKFGKNTLLRRFLLRIYAASEKTVAISHFTSTQLARFGVEESHIEIVFPGAPKRIAVESSLLDALREHFAPQGARMVFSLGRFIPRKGQQTLVEAMPAILEKHPNTVLVMAGRGPCRKICLRRAKALGIEKQVCCPGYLDEQSVAGLYTLCDIFALPVGEGEAGQVEGFGLVFSEAHAYAKPVVAGNSGGVPDAVLDGETGVLVSPQDVTQTAQAIVALLDDPEKAQALGVAGRKRVKKLLNWTTFTEGTLSGCGDKKDGAR